MATVAVLAAMTAAAVAAQDSPVLWRHLSSGRIILQIGLPRLDPLTLLGAQRLWANTTWLFDLASYLLFLGGPVVFSFVHLLAVVLVAIGYAGQYRSLPAPVALLPVLLAVPSLQDSLRWSPELLSLLILLAFLTALDRWQHTGSLPAGLCLALVQVVWANSSSWMLLGPILVAARCGGSGLEAWVAGGDAAFRTAGRRWLGGFLICLCSTVATPFGLRGLLAAWIDLFAAFMVPAAGQALLPSLAAIWSAGWQFWNVAFLLLVLTWALYSIFYGGTFYQSLPATAVFVVLAVLDTRWVPLAAAWLVWASQRESPFGADRDGACAAWRLHAPSLWFYRAACSAAWLSVLWGAGTGVREGLAHLQRMLARDTLVERRSHWFQERELAGAIAAIDPADAGWLVWSNPNARPVLDDRISLFAQDYPLYHRLCIDLVHDRHNTYVRADGSSGGWRQMVHALPLAWLVTPAGDLDTNMALNSSLYWAPVYWDAGIVLYGRKQHELARAADQRLSQLRQVAGRNGPAELNRRIGIGDLSDYSRAETVNLAKVYAALSFPEVADYLMSRLDGEDLVREREKWQVERGGAREQFRIQGADRDSGFTAP